MYSFYVNILTYFFLVIYALNKKIRVAVNEDYYPFNVVITIDSLLFGRLSHHIQPIKVALLLIPFNIAYFNSF